MPSTTTHPFTRPEALAAGLTVDQLAGPGYQRLFHGVYLPAQVLVTELDRAREAIRVSAPGTYASHQTAAIIWGGWVPDTSETHISVPEGATRTKRQGIRAHRAPASALPLKHHGLLVSSPLQTFRELAASRLDLVDLVVFGDSLVRARRTTVEEVRHAASSWVGVGSALARRAAALVRQGVDSPAESRLRMVIVLAGLPEPEVNVITRLVGGDWSRRFDLCYRGLKLIIEYDGRHHATDPGQWSHDILRREELEAQGWTMIVITADALYNHPRNTLGRITNALRDRHCPDLPPRIPPRWARHFGHREEAVRGSDA